MTIDNAVAKIRFPALVKQPDIERSALLELLSERVSDLSELSPYFFLAEISNTRVDSHHTHMTSKTLRNFAKACFEGISFLDSHAKSRLGIGYSLNGEFQESSNRTVSTFYTQPGIEFGGQHSYRTTDDFIKAIQSALVRDVSVGFYGGDWTCDICRNNWFDYEMCSHWPGRQYIVDDSIVVCTVEIDGAELSEVSAVYDGSTPGAMILKAERMSGAGLLEPESARELEVQYKIKLPESKKIFVTPTFAPENMGKNTFDLGTDSTTREKLGDGQMNEKEIRTLLGIGDDDSINERISGLIEEVSTANDRLKSLRNLATEFTPKDVKGIEDGIRWLADEVTRLIPLADDGKAYRMDLIDDALKEGVRAYGNEFASETYRTILEGLPDMGSVKRMRDDWKRLADERLKAGQLIDSEDQNTDVVSFDIPEQAYRN